MPLARRAENKERVIDITWLCFTVLSSKLFASNDLLHAARENGKELNVMSHSNTKTKMLLNYSLNTWWGRKYKIVLLFYFLYCAIQGQSVWSKIERRE